MLKDVLEKALSSVLVAAIMGLCALMYSEFETYKEIRELLKVKAELESTFTKNIDDLKKKDTLIEGKLNRLERIQRNDSTDIQYVKSWVNYWRNN